MARARPDWRARSRRGRSTSRRLPPDRRCVDTSKLWAKISPRESRLPQWVRKPPRRFATRESKPGNPPSTDSFRQCSVPSEKAGRGKREAGGDLSVIRIGTRASELAQRQARIVEAALLERGIVSELV